MKYPEIDPEADAFFFGDDVIALPIFDQGKEEASIELPENDGGWYFKDRPVKGRQTLPCTIHDEPLYFIKGGSVIYDGETFKVYPLERGAFHAEYLLDDGLSPLKEGAFSFAFFDIECHQDTIFVHTKGCDKDRIQVLNPGQRKVVID